MLGLPTILSLTPRGWFIPHRYAPLLPPPGAQPPYDVIEALFDRHAGDFEQVLDLVEAQGEALQGTRSLLDQAEKERAEAHKAANTAHREAEKARRELGRLERS